MSRDWRQECRLRQGKHNNSVLLLAETRQYCVISHRAARILRRMGLRIKELRKEYGVTQRELAAGIGESYQTLQKIEGAEIRLSWDRARKIAEYLNCRITDLDSELYEEHQTLPVMGYVGAGSAVYPFDRGGELERADAPPGAPASAVAVVVRGNSMYPAYGNGDKIFFVPNESISPDIFLTKECVVQLDDGRLLVKRISRGSRSGRWNLHSYNAPDIDDVKLTWVAKVRWIERR